MRQKPRKGAIALCSGDIPGIITGDEPVPSKFEGGGVYWPGVNLLTGEGWGSRSPVVLGTFAELLSSGLPVGEWITIRRSR
jgi:hypothetical protein